jgi:putative oxidoreductase
MGTTDKLMTQPLKCCYKSIGKFDKTKTRGTKMKFLDNLLEGREDQAYALLRIVTGFLFIWHGAQKLFNYPKDFPYPLNPLMYSAGTIELVGGLLVMIGLFTRPAAFICSGTMAVAYWMVHGLNNIHPMLNGGELAALYCFAFLFIAARGPGIWSLDK